MRPLISKAFVALPVVLAILLGMVLGNLTMTETQSVNASPFDDVQRVASPVVQSGGAGFQPQATDSCPCNGDCLTEVDVRKIVRDECTKQRLNRSVASGTGVLTSAVTYSSPVVTYSQPTVTYGSSQPVTYSQPATAVVRRGLFGRRVYTTSSGPSSGTCRIVNGVRVCN